MLVDFVVRPPKPVGFAVVERFVGGLLPEIRLRRAKPESCRASVAGAGSSSRLASQHQVSISTAHAAYMPLSYYHVALRGLVIHSPCRARG